jgi:hypothetical protein
MKIEGETKRRNKDRSKRREKREKYKMFPWNKS